MKGSLHAVCHSLLVAGPDLAQACGFLIFGLLVEVLDDTTIFKDLRFCLEAVLRFLTKNVID